jgi:GNAT superfamily N-acetyltransferase
MRAASGIEPSDAAAVERQRRAYDELHVNGKFVAYLAWVDGEPAAAGAAGFCADGVTLGGAGTLPELRGHGAYTALVRARWDAAVERETPALVVQAGAMSRPILERLGFQSLGDVDVLLDDFSNSRAS